MKENKASPMEKLATFIVDKRNLFFLLYIFADGSKDFYGYGSGLIRWKTAVSPTSLAYSIWIFSQESQ